MSLSRRGALALGLGALATPTLTRAEDLRPTAPSAADAAAWSRYEGRLRSRLADAGGGAFDDAGARHMLELTNRARAAAGSPPLAWLDELAQTASAHAADLVKRGYVEHLSPEGFDPSHRFWLLGRTTIGSPSENIAYHRGEAAPAPPAQLLGIWRGSPGHWRNLLRPSHTHAGFGLVRTRGHAWLVGLFARPLAMLTEPLPFHARGPDLGQALRSLPADLRPRLSIPQGSRLGTVAGPPPVLQITAIRRIDTGAFDIIGGPIFLAGG